MGLLDLFRRKKKNEVFYYSEKDQDAFERLISEKFGDFSEVFHELASPDLHIDVIPVPPSADRDHWILFTMGMGAYRMPVPDRYGKMNRAEMAIRLPADWDVHSSEEKWYWPVRTIKMLARLPHYEKSWLGLDHDIDFGSPFSEETEMCGAILQILDESVEPLTLECGDRLILYNVIPLYRSEMEFKSEHGAEELLGRMAEETLHGPVDVRRPPVA